MYENGFYSSMNFFFYFILIIASLEWHLQRVFIHL